MKKAVVLLSGGIDSATALYFAKDSGYSCFCLSFDYGQRHKKEIDFARQLAASAKSKWHLLKIQLPWKGSALLDKKISIPKSRLPKDMPKGIPPTYVPARNMIFLSFGISCAEATGAGSVFIGANALDFSGYPDCRPEFYKAFAQTISTGTRVGTLTHSGSVQKHTPGVCIETPLIDKTKGEIVKLGVRLGVPFELTWSCYKGGKRPCGECDACILRQKAFREAWVPDPLVK